MKITIFSEELRKCLNAAGMSDCGENDTWNYWYQRLMNAYNESVERQIMTEQTENEELRELVRDMWFWGYEGHMDSESQEWQMKHIDGVLDRMRKLGVEVDE